MGVGSQNTFLTYNPYPIAGLCCEFQLSKGKTIGGDALQRPKSASKIYLSMDLRNFGEKIIAVEPKSCFEK